MSLIDIIGMSLVGLVMFSAFPLLTWIVYATLRRWFWPHEYSTLGWLAQLERHVTRWPRLLAWPYLAVKWTLVVCGAAALLYKAFDEVQRGEPGGGVAFAVGLPLAFLIHVVTGLNKVRHRDGA